MGDVFVKNRVHDGGKGKLPPHDQFVLESTSSLDVYMSRILARGYNTQGTVNMCWLPLKLWDTKARYHQQRACITLLHSVHSLDIRTPLGEIPLSPPRPSLSFWSSWELNGRRSTWWLPSTTPPPNVFNRSAASFSALLLRRSARKPRSLASATAAVRLFCCRASLTRTRARFLAKAQ